MKIIYLVVAGLFLSLTLQSCGGEDASGEDTDNDAANTESNAGSSENTDSTNENDENESNSNAESDSKENLDYHISLDSDNGEMATGMVSGKALISDQAIICTVGDWKLRVLTDEYSPKKMVGNMYPAHIFSKKYDSQKCTCQFMNVEGTGVDGAAGERVKMEGEITCDEGAVYGTFIVPMIEPKK
ncbi:MAG: hypothetical protein ACFHU9_02410 [Fluviicola sp.]